MQEACEITFYYGSPSLVYDEKVEEICYFYHEENVVAANYNCPGQLVIRDQIRELRLPVRKWKKPVQTSAALALLEELSFTTDAALQPKKLKGSHWNQPNLISQSARYIKTREHHKGKWCRSNQSQSLSLNWKPLWKWLQSVATPMAKDGAIQFIECGPGKVLQGLVKRFIREAEVVCDSNREKPARRFFMSFELNNRLLIEQLARKSKLVIPILDGWTSAESLC